MLPHGSPLSSSVLEMLREAHPLFLPQPVWSQDPKIGIGSQPALHYKVEGCSLRVGGVDGLQRFVADYLDVSTA